ncbi:hypothetical protein NQ317_000868 [Molorchus minor]|uniref:Uncharacterized protein n=1 Tax=Molorchus minor TaxID=1323400 RepID=A0ABQ9JTI9_9CUCU|nr:hypothetical protein NQ317_000868 [Molorchus minor]
MVQDYNSKEPFNFSVSSLLNNAYETFVTIYAAYLFDSVKLYASALHYLLMKEPILTDKVIMDVASNGTKIIETIIQINKTYKTGPGNLSIRIKHIVIGPGVTAVVTAPKSRSSAGWFSLQFDIEETGSKLVKVVLKKTCLSGVKNCGISCGSGTDMVLKHNC